MIKLLIVGLGCLLVVYLLAQFSRKESRASIEGRSILTPNEAEFFARLMRALPELHVFPQVGLGALLVVSNGVPKRQTYGVLNRFNSKRADFVVCEKTTLKVLAVIELDDRSHNSKRAKDTARDEMLSFAGYRVVRFESKRKPSEAEIAALFRVEPDLGPQQ